MSIKSRIPKAQQAVVAITEDPGKFWVNGSNNKTYKVNLSDWQRRKIEDIEFLDLHCECKTSNENCPGNEHTICYHSLAVAIYKANLANKTLTLFDSLKDALNYSNLGGQLVRISSVGGHAWGVVKNKPLHFLAEASTPDEIREARQARLANNPLRFNEDKFID